MEALAKSFVISPATERPAWKALREQYQQVSKLHLRQLFADDPGRGGRMTAEAAGIYLDYSKNRITDQPLELLVQLAHESGLPERIDAMFRGERINTTENRAAPSCGPPCTARRINRRGRPERRAPGARRTRQDGRIL